MRGAFGLALALFAFGCIVGQCAGCASATERAEQAIVVGVYERELDACIAQGKASGSFAVYQACARTVDRRMCVERGLRCAAADGGST